MGKIPLGVLILAIFAIVAGATSIIIGLIVVWYNGILDLPISLGSILADVNGFLGFTASNLIFSIVDIAGNINLALLTIPIIDLVLAYSYLKSLRWSWYLGIAFYAVGLLYYVVNIIYGAGMVTIALIIIYVIILYYFSRPKVRLWFNV